MGNVRDIFREIADPGAELYSVIGEITAIDQEEMTCDVQPLNGSAAIFGVRMSAAPDHSGLHIIPLVGSTCIVTFLSKDTAFLSMASDLDHVLIDVEGTAVKVYADGVEMGTGNSEFNMLSAETMMASGAEVKVASGGVLVKNGAETLRSILDDLITQIGLLTVGTPAGPSTVPVNAAAFNLIKARIATLLTTN